MGIVAVLVTSGCSSTSGSGDAAPGGAPAQSKSELQFAGRYHLPTEHAQWDRLYQEELERLAIDRQRQGMIMPPPDAPFARFVKPDEATSVWAECLRGQGFEATVDWDGGLSLDSQSAEQRPAMLAADFRCRAMYPVHPKYLQPHTETQIRVVYDYYTKTLAPCLQAKGYDIDPSSIPTWETFLANYAAKDGSWFPYDAVTKREEEITAANGGVLPSDWQDEWQRINHDCPQSPPLNELFPEDK